MPRLVIGKNGVVTNVINHVADAGSGEAAWLVTDDAQTINVGDAFDVRDPQVDGADPVSYKIHFRHENLIRQLTRALRATSTAANNAATAAGLPTTANSADLTLAQFRAAVKSLL